MSASSMMTLSLNFIISLSFLFFILFYLYSLFFFLGGKLKWRGSKRTAGKVSTRGYIFIRWQEWFIPDCYAWFCWLCNVYLCIFHFFFSRLTSDQRWMDERLSKRETCYWGLNATIEIPPAYMSNHRFRVLENIIMR